MVLTRLPLLAGPTDGERFSGGGREVAETDERVLDRLETLLRRKANVSMGDTEAAAVKCPFMRSSCQVRL